MTIDHLKMVFGFCLLVILGVLAYTIAHGEVKSDTSFGLMPILTTISTLAGAFAGWAFRQAKDKDDK